MTAWRKQWTCKGQMLTGKELGSAGKGKWILQEILFPRPFLTTALFPHFSLPEFLHFQITSLILKKIKVGS
jgi:hypothetical protein